MHLVSADVTLSDGAFAGAIIGSILGGALISGLIVGCIYCCQIVKLGMMGD